MSRLDIWLDRFAKVSCIGSFISQIVFGILGLRVVSQAPLPAPSAPPDRRPLYYFLGWLISIAYSLTMGYFIFGRKGEIDSKETGDTGLVNERDQLRNELERLKVQKPDTSFRTAFFLVCANGYPLQRTQWGIALNLQIISSTLTKLVYAKATLARREGYHGQTHQIELESSEPHIITPMQTFVRMLEIKLDQEEAKRFMAPNVEIMGQLKLEENNAHRVVPFQLVTHRECPDDPNVPQLRMKLQEAETRIAALRKPVSLRGRVIRLFDLLGPFEQEYKEKFHIERQPGESESDFDERNIANGIRSYTQMTADFRIQFEDEVRSINDQVQLKSGTVPLLLNAIDQAAKACKPQTIKEMREYLWECARTMEN